MPVNVNIGVADDKNRIESQLGVVDKSIIQNLLSICCQPAVGSSSGFNVTFLRDGVIKFSKADANKTLVL